MGLLTVLLLIVFGACFSAGIVFHLGWLVVIGMVVVPVAVVLGLYGGASAGQSDHQPAH